jgi:hypothetical protein
MTSLRRTLERLFKGPVGGMFLCLLIAGFLGGVAVAHPGAPHDKATVEQSSDDPSEAPEAPEQDQGSADPTGGQQASHTGDDCKGTLTDVKDLPEIQDATGLAHAIWVVEANCEKNLQAPGLVNALTHLVTNWQCHQAHEAGTTCDAHGPPEGHGPPDVHGNSGVHGNSAEHSNGGVHGNSAEHSNASHGTSASDGS